VRALSLASIDEVFHEVEAGRADFGVVPIENSTEGSVNHTLDRFLNSPLHICGEVELRIHQNLMGNVGSLREVKRVCSHPQSLAQCRQWLNANLPDAERIPESSNAEAARRARDERGTAAIAGVTAAEVYGLKILANEIEDRPDNSTRFLVVGRRNFGPSGNDRTTLLVSTGHTESPGALYRLLEPLAQNEVSLTRIESPAVATPQMGLRILHGSRGAHRRSARWRERSPNSKPGHRCAACSVHIPRRCFEALASHARWTGRRFVTRTGRQIGVASRTDVGWPRSRCDHGRRISR
jgi:prephenate dehydratase